MKKLLQWILLSFLFFFINLVHAQEPYVEWQRSLGGTDYDQGHSILQTNDGGFIIAGISYSNDGDVSGHHGVVGNNSKADYWIVKLNESGNIIWQKSLGGTKTDYAESIQQTADGGFIVGGWSLSNNDDVSGNHNYADYWIVRLDTAGNIVWQKSLGGSLYDEAYSAKETSDGGFIVAGYSYSVNGDVSGSHGSGDGWIVKLDSSGNLQWQKSLGGSAFDGVLSILETSDEGFMVAGFSASSDGDVTGNHGLEDCWIVKLDSSGNINWQKSLGGSENDEARSIQTADGGFIVGGYSNSNDGDVSGHHGSTFYSDYWVVKLDSTGNILWQKSLGGSNNDQARSVQPTADGGYIVAGFSESSDGDVSGNHGIQDYWIVKLDSTGNISWEKWLGGSNWDEAYSIQQLSDEGYIVAGATQSGDGDVSGFHGVVDCWVLKLSCEALQTFYADADADGFGNASDSLSACSIPEGYVADSTDCDDTNANVYPGAQEIPNNGIDDNCNGYVDEFGVGVNEATSNAFFSIFPNSNNGIVAIAATLQYEEFITIKLLDLTGRELYSENIGNVNGSFIRQLDLSNFSSGTYLLQFIHNGQCEVKKLSIEK